MDFDFTYTWQAVPRLLSGAKISLALAVTSLGLSIVLGTILAVVRAIAPRPTPTLVAVYVSFIRGTPLLVQIFLVFYVLPLIGINLPPLVAGVAALSLNSAAYVAEIIKGALGAIPNGQAEAARSLGLRPTTVWLRVILPQAFIAAIPPLVNEFTLVLKATPLVSVITVVELLRTAQQIYASNFRPLEVLTGVAIIFFLMNFGFSRAAAVLERSLAVRRR